MIKQRRARPPITPPTIAPTLFEEAGLASVLAIASFVASGLVELSVREEAGEGNDDVGGAVTPELLPVTVDEDFDAEDEENGVNFDSKSTEEVDEDDDLDLGAFDDDEEDEDPDYYEEYDEL